MSEQGETAIRGSSSWEDSGYPCPARCMRHPCPHCCPQSTCDAFPSATVEVLRGDVEALIRLVRGQSLPADMEGWRSALVERLADALGENEDECSCFDEWDHPEPQPPCPRHSGGGSE